MILAPEGWLWCATRQGADPVLVLTAGLALGRDRRNALGAVERLAAIEELAVHGGDGADAQGVALAAPYGHPLVERGPLGGVQFGSAEEVRDLAGHVEGDRQLWGGTSSMAVWSGRRPATAVRIAPRLTP